VAQSEGPEFKPQYLKKTKQGVTQGIDPEFKSQDWGKKSVMLLLIWNRNLKYQDCRIR
jgi:hypothetical protein